MLNITTYVIIESVTGQELRTARTLSDWSQAEAAERLGVTQAYLSMVERGTRPVSQELASAVLQVYPLPATARPIELGQVRPATESFFKAALGKLGYPGFAYLKGGVLLNPAELLLRALDSADLDSRVVEALPWLPLRFPEMDWNWLTAEAKLRDRQNRLAFVTELARQIANADRDDVRAGALEARVATLERSRLAGEDTLCKESMSEVERRWLRSHRSRLAAHWNLLTDLKAEDLSHVHTEASA